MLVGHVADQLHDQNRLADTGAAEQADLAAACIGRQQVNHLDAGLQHLGCGQDLGKAGCLPVDGQAFGILDRALAVNRIADHVEHPSQGRLTDRHHDGRTGVKGIDAAGNPVGR